MKLGLLTNCLGPCTIGEAEAVAIDLGLDCLEIGPSVQLDAEAFRAVMDRGKIRIASLIYCRNLLSSNESARAEFRAETERRIRFCMDNGVPQMTLTTGVQPEKTLEENIALFKDYFEPLCAEAAAKHVRLSYEFCPTMGALAAGPYQWRKLFAAAPIANFGLNYDPSHLVWEMIDYLAPIAEFAPKIFSVHVKDTVVLPEKLKEHGCLRLVHEPNVDGDAYWWKHRVPGDGEIRWPEFFGELRKAGFDGVATIELEDPAYSGSREKQLEGARKAIRYLDSIGVRG
ncbi:MAG: Inosose dehydratase [candidate division BRC1 bacterium ADurb.BinA364]|nr:MAG: Inosose dehydratase [candidate division BRC1 bacterium ADurb.BinA364]